MNLTTTKPQTSGEIVMVDGNSFHWIKNSAPGSEIYGWIQKDYNIVQGTGGFWRTEDADEAAKRASAASGIALA